MGDIAAAMGSGNVFKNIFNAELALHVESVAFGTLSSFVGAAIVLLLLDVSGIGRKSNTQLWSKIYCGPTFYCWQILHSA
jgi:hypothetical protein